MEKPEMLESVRVLENGVHSFDDDAEQINSSLKGSGLGEDLGVDLLEDLDSYWEDINERLIISRMVSDSVIKGMVNAVEEEAADKIASKELELANLKDLLNRFRVDEGRNRSIFCIEIDNVKDSLQSLKNAACEEFQKLKQEINSVRKIGSGSELGELVGNLKENGNVRWDCVDKTLENLESVVHAVCSTVDHVVCSSKNSILECREEMEFRREVEAMVIQSSIRSIQEEFEEKIGDQNANFSGYKSVNWVEKFEEISCLRKELDVVLKLLPNQETSQLISHGSYDMDHSGLPSLHESNGHDDSKTRVPDEFDAAKFSHMTSKELIKFFNTTIMEMKREHESILQQKTEHYYNLKKRYLNERASFLPLRKDKESDVLRKKIPEVIMKLDDILVENEKIPVFNDNVESISSLKNRLDNLLFENRQLRDLITDKKNEVKCLSSQVFDADKKISDHALNEAYLGKLVENLELDKEDAKVEASIHEDVYKCVLKELSCMIESHNEGKLGQENERVDEIQDSEMKSLIMQGLCEVIYEESIKEAVEKAKELFKEVLIANERRVELEKEASKKEKEFKFIFQEKEKSRDNLLAELKNVKEQLEFSSQELHKLRDRVNLQQNLIFEKSEELNAVKAKLLEAMDQEHVHKMEINEVNEKLKLSMEELKKADEAKKMVHALSREKENVLLQFEVQKNEHAKKIEALVVLVNEFSKKIVSFESKVKEGIEENNSRLKNSRYQLKNVMKKVSDVARTESLYKQRLERRCSDLKIAEEEVDLLGDEVEALLSLLEKIYIALDHYSPILKHYPGIIEILKLVRKELGGERTKSF